MVNLFAIDATIEIAKKKDKHYKIMVEDSTGEDVSQTLNRKFFKILVGDLQASANFIVHEDYYRNDFDATFHSEDVLENSIELLLRYKLEKSDDGNLLSKIKLYNIRSGSILIDKQYTMKNKSMYPFLSHKIISDLTKEIGGENVDWMNRYIVFSKYTTPGNSSIYLSDYTLSYQKRVISGGLNIFPKWGDREQKTIYYTKIIDNLPTLYRYNLYTGAKRYITSSAGMLVCSDVNEDGTKLLLTMSPNGLPDVYLYDLNSGSKRKLTKFSGIDVSGQFVENETKVVFVSDRLGYPNIYMVDVNTKNVERLVYHGKNNSSCSTNGNYIVYSSREKSSSSGRSIFNLYLISTQSEFVRQLTSIGKNHFPRFAKDSDAILFIKNFRGQSSLGLIRLNANISFDFPLKVGKIQSIDW